MDDESKPSLLLRRKANRNHGLSHAPETRQTGGAKAGRAMIVLRGHRQFRSECAALAVACRLSIIHSVKDSIEYAGQGRISVDCRQGGILQGLGNRRDLGMI
jgi:hypothetical protein